MMPENKRAELVIKIKKAFKKTPFPGNKIGDKEELTEFLGKRWEEIRFDDLNRNSGFLLWFDPNGLIYYLQAFMVAILEYPEKVTTDVKENLVRYLGGEQPKSEKFRKLFSEEQQELILQFLLNLQYDDLYPPTSQKLNPGAQRLVARRKAEYNAMWNQAIDYWK
ncbi:MAG: DUF6714 family protein [Chloroflexota bacterium]